MLNVLWPLLLQSFQNISSPSRKPHIQFNSVAQSCPTLCDSMDCSTPGFLARHQLPELSQTHVHRVGDAIHLISSGCLMGVCLGCLVWCMSSVAWVSVNRTATVRLCPWVMCEFPTISSSFIPFSSCFQSLPASGSFPVSQLFASGGQSIGVSASMSVLPMIIHDWFPLPWTGLISLQSKGLSRIFSNTAVQKH